MHVTEPKENGCGDVITTDEDGKAFHRDIRNYNYSKTYCMGHPAPEGMNVTKGDEGGDGGEGDGEAEDCNCEEENERLRGTVAGRTGIVRSCHRFSCS